MARVLPSAEPLAGADSRLPRSLRVAVAVASAALVAYGVLLLDWPVLTIMLLFWHENVLIGAFNVLKMLSTGAQRRMMRLALFTALFFTVHYGVFTLFHGLFVISLFGTLQDNGTLTELYGIWRATVLEDPAFLVALGGLLILQLTEFIGWRTKAPPPNPLALMGTPYVRVCILHATLAIGATLVQTLGTPVVGVLLLIVLKLGADLLQIAWPALVELARRKGAVVFAPRRA
jgi:hypothetical protein